MVLRVVLRNRRAASCSSSFWTLRLTYLENTEAARQSNRRLEFGDERDARRRVGRAKLGPRPQLYSFAPGLLRMQSAHQMGGCGMSADPTQGVVNGDGRHHQLKNLSVHDASVFPTSLGANPQDLISILQAMKSAGALRAELEII